MHFCGDDFQLINLFGETKTCCPSQEPMPGCCDDISNLELPNTDQQQIDVLNFQPLGVEMPVSVADFLMYEEALGFIDKVLGYADSSPPILPNTPIFISNQAFLI